MENHEQTEKQIFDLLHELKELPATKEGNPFVLLPQQELVKLKNKLEEYSEELTFKLNAND